MNFFSQHRAPRRDGIRSRDDGPAPSARAHFGEWIQGRIGPEGPVALVTLPCAALRLSLPGPTPLPFPPAALDRFARRLGMRPSAATPAGATLNFPPGAGCGASTAALVALARGWGWRGGPERLAAACVDIEGASDPLMFPRPDALLWASREARILRRLPQPPAASILGGFWGPPRPTAPQDADFDDIAGLARDWEAAAGARDLPRLARIATASAAACSARRDPAGPIADLARDLGALGWMRAHTGSARGLIFAPGHVPAHGAEALREAGVSGALDFSTGDA